MRLIDDPDGARLTFDCDAVPVAETIRTAGHEPNGYFWESLLDFVEPKLARTIDYDSEADAFFAYGPVEDLRSLQATLAPLVSDPSELREVLRAAEAADYEFDD